MTEVSSSSVQDILQTAFNAFASGNVEEAHALLQTATETKRVRDDVEQLFALSCMNASIAAMEGSNDIASLMRHARNHTEHDSATLYLEGLSAMAKNNLQTARIKFEEAKRQDKYFVIANLGLAAISFESKKYAESFALYREVLSVLGSSLTPSVVRVGMGLCAYYLHRLEFAQRCLERVLAMDPENELALFALLVVYLDRRMFIKITEVVIRLRRLLPHNALILLKVADLLYFKAITDHRLKNGRAAQMTLLDRVYAVGTAEECAMADFEHGRWALACNDISVARRYLESALRVLPQLLSARIHYARVLLYSGQEKDGLQLLVSINKEHPGQREVLMLLALHATRHGQHELALQYCHTLMESEESTKENMSSWALCAWCARVDSEKCKQLFAHTIALYHANLETPPWEVLANVAVLSNNGSALQGFVDRELGGKFLERTTIPHKYIPLLYNLALLLEQEDRHRAKEIYKLLVKCQSHFTLPYFRLHVLAYEEKQYSQSVAWLTLLCEVAPREPMAQSYLAQLFFSQRQMRASMNLLRNNSFSSSTKRHSIPIMLTLAALYLWCSQQRGRDDARFLRSAKEHFLFVLRNDKGNILAAHGLACCLGLSGDFDHCQSMLGHVGEITTNYSYVLTNHRAHMANVKMLGESYKAAMDYLMRSSNRTPAQNSLLAFCLTSEQRYEEAIELLAKTVETIDKENNTTINGNNNTITSASTNSFNSVDAPFVKTTNPHITLLPKLVYNLALLYCTSFLRRIAKSHSLTIEEGRKVRQMLESGIALASRFLHHNHQNTSRNAEIRLCRVFIKSVCAYCLRVYELSLERLLLIGKESELEQIREAEHWAETYRHYQEELSEEEKRKDVQVTQQQAAHEDAGKEVLEHFKQRRESDPLKLFDPDLIAASLAELGNAPLIPETEMNTDSAAEAILAGMQLDLPENTSENTFNMGDNGTENLTQSIVALQSVTEQSTYVHMEEANVQSKYAKQTEINEAPLE